ncbi:MAG: 4Fe-4S binding protein [Acidobacteria bacterium]|nr:4Fe-4S binding protein [Acidobacteriota bacterium]
MEASGTSPSAPGGKRVREATAVINQELCIQCGLCIEACPEQAIRINGITEIDQSKCTGCGACANVCPNEAISIQEIALHRARS